MHTNVMIVAKHSYVDVQLVTHRLYLEFMLRYSPIVPGVYVILLTDCIWSLCFVTHRLYLEFMFCYSPIVPGVYDLLLTD
jgi:ABC-type sulfate transport system permease subunit